MSSTNRGGKRSEADFYATPAWCVDRLLDVVDLPLGRWLEPCAGEGAIISACSTREGVTWSAVELREACRPRLQHALPGGDVVIGDYLELEPRRSEVIITNPPFSLAEPIILKANEEADVVVMLLRLNFLGSAKRSAYLRATKPDLYILPNRPSFTGKGTDSIEYAWFVWDNRAEPKTMGRWMVLADTPREDRRRTEPRS